MLGIKQDEKDQFTGKRSSKLVSETGGALLFTQGPQGEVLVLIYPCDSEVLKFNDKHITYKIYAYPCKITKQELQKIIKFYFRFVYMTSFVGRIGLTDRLRLGWIKFKVGFDILKFGKSVFGVAQKALEIVTGVSGLNGK
jgi:hypothetical protein